MARLDELNFAIVSPCILARIDGTVVVIRCRLTFIFVALYREDSDDDDIEKGDNKIPR